MSRADDVAFPRPYGCKPEPPADGLTIREHFAAMAMQGLCACHGTAGLNRGVGETVERAVQVADALIVELAKAKP